MGKDRQIFVQITRSQVEIVSLAADNRLSLVPEGRAVGYDKSILSHAEIGYLLVIYLIPLAEHIGLQLRRGAGNCFDHRIVCAGCDNH